MQFSLLLFIQASYNSTEGRSSSYYLTTYMCFNTLGPLTFSTQAAKISQHHHFI